jgi:hydrogenase maturation protease
MPRILVAGVGNIFLGDDAFGVEVVQRLLRRPLPDGVHVVDFGIRGLDLTYALLDDFAGVVIIDAMPRGGAPGTLYVLEPDAGTYNETAPLLDAHAMDPIKVLRAAAAMGGHVGQLLVVGCEPSPGDPDEFQDGLSDPVRAAVERAVELVETLAGRLLRGEPMVNQSEPAVPSKEVQPCPN